jgi:hypothetical protein
MDSPGVFFISRGQVPLGRSQQGVEDCIVKTIYVESDFKYGKA